MNEFLNPYIAYMLISNVDIDIKNYLDIFLFNDKVSIAECVINDYSTNKYGFMIFFSKEYNNNDLRNKAMKIIRENSDKGIKNIHIKYFDYSEIINLKNDGEEVPCIISTMNEDINNSAKIYFLNTKPFIIRETKRYVPIKEKSEIKTGMVLEVKNQDKWIKKVVKDVDMEYEKIYKLFIKHGKIRCEYQMT
jgi:hypothetical protein